MLYGKSLICGIIAGLFLAEGSQKGVLLSLIYQGLQILVFSSSMLTYSFSSGFSLYALIGPHGPEVTWHLGSGCELSIFVDKPDIVGINLVALSLFVYLLVVYSHIRKRSLATLTCSRVDAGEGEVPLRLKVIAYIFLIAGTWSVIEAVLAVFQGRHPVHLGILGIPIFFGLVRLSNGWRVCAVALLWLGLISFLVVFLLSVKNVMLGCISFCGLTLDHIPRWIVSAGAASLFCLTLWQYIVLTKPNTRRLFKPITHKTDTDCSGDMRQ